jgi:hypothetical protein
MDSFTDYYVVLGVDSKASPGTIKTAFKKLALKYHPDVYKGVDAEERMRILLLAYQTLSDPASRRNYDVQRSEHLLHTSGISQDELQRARDVARPLSGFPNTASTAVGQDKQRRFVFPDLDTPLSTPLLLRLGDVTFQLWPDDIFILKHDGLLRGVASRSTDGQSHVLTSRSENYCHRCHHRWVPASITTRSPASGIGIVCPACKASDWAEYLLLRCIHCHAVFESEEIRDKILGGGRLYFPYELYPLCPNCRRSQWCPSENARIETLRAAAARRRALLLMSVLVVVAFVIGIAAVVALR